VATPFVSVSCEAMTGLPPAVTVSGRPVPPPSIVAPLPSMTTGRATTTCSV
jgi:hypothetical protein